MKKHLVLSVVTLVFAAGSALAFVEPTPSPLAEKEVRLAGLDAEPSLARIADLDTELAAGLESDLTALGLDSRYAVVDTRGGHWATLWLKRPLVPGTGVGNDLTWTRLGLPAAPENEALGDAAWNQLLAFLGDRRPQLRIDPTELAARIGVTSGGQLIQIHASRRVDGVPVRGAGVAATVNHGNLILFGTERWGEVAVSTTPTLSSAAAMARLEAHLAPFAPARYRDKPRLELLPIGVAGDVGHGWSHRLAWILEPHFDGLIQNYEAAVDAHTGELLLLRDTNHYATRNVKGGVYPVSYDGIGPEGVEVPGYPMPFADVVHGGGTATTDSGGNLFDITGNITTSLEGPFILIDEFCGPISETGADGDLDLGTSPLPDCDTPPGASAGNTHAARSGFYELNRIKEMARGHWPTPGPPAHAWLNAQLTAEMNISQVCNAFWTGTVVQFFRETPPCANTGQIAGIFDHEWGHGIDDNGTAGSVSFPGEGIADIYAALRLNTSCIGRGFRTDGAVCGGYGDPCTPASGCTGVRDIDWANRTSGLPHDVDWVTMPGNQCGSVHCRGTLYSESVWDLWKRDLPTFYGLDGNTAHEIAARVTFLGADNVTTWFVLDNTGGGCGATSGYQQFLGADDDNGDLTDGTPHMQAIFSAFDRHQIACATPTVQDSGCAVAPTTAPVVTGSPNDTGADLSWTAVPDATRYKIFRTDGEFQCAFGKTIVGETTGTFFSDSGLQNGREYSYVVAAFGASDACMGPTSACAAVVPMAGLSAASSAVEICAGTDAVYTITVSAPFTPPVDMSLVGNPAPTTATFVPDPVAGPLPEDTVLTIGNTAGVAAGDYLMTATGDDTVTLFNANLLLSVFDAVPSAPALVAPGDGATDVSPAPSYEWTASSQGDEYILEVDDDPGFGSIDYTVTVTGTTHVQATPLALETTYFWRVRTANVCGAGGTSPTFSFTTVAGSLLCNVTAVDFETGIPIDWMVVDNTGGTGIVWTLVSDSACAIDNRTPGTGDAACADSDAAGTPAIPFDTELVSNPIDTTGMVNLTLTLAAYYRDLNTGSNDRFEIDAWNGTAWVNELSWDEDHEAGEIVNLNLDDYAGQTDLQVRFRYFGDGFDWFAQVDDVEIACVVTPIIFEDGFESGDTSMWSLAVP